MTSPPTPSPTPPPWPHCAEGTTTTDPVGCRGVHVTGHTRCLAHLNPTDRTSHLATLTPGSDVDHRGTTFDGPLLAELLDALRDVGTIHPRLGRALFDGATFSAAARFGGVTFGSEARFKGTVFSAEARFDGARFIAEARFDGSAFTTTAWFGGATFGADASFSGATFTATARFNGVRFSVDARFEGTTFSAGIRFSDAMFSAHARFRGATFLAEARFGGTTFTADAQFDHATFGAEARFGGARFIADARFDGATFSAAAWFGGAIFGADARFGDAIFTTGADFDGVVVDGDVWFNSVRFESVAVLGPLWCWGELDVSRAVFGAPVVIETAAAAVRCERTRWEATATLRLWHADLDMTGAVLNFPLAVVSAAADTDPVRVLSVSGVDAAHLVLTDTDLTACRFLGAFHLDQLRLEGDTRFARTPLGTDLLRGLPLRWTDRLALAEEHHWRALSLPRRRPRLRTGWTSAPPSPSGSPSPVPGPAALAALYRQLRKAFEDGKDEPGAADFYMGEMEMRRLDRRPGRSRAERGLLTAYWALSGYGLRASRALTWLLLAMTATVLAMMLWGTAHRRPEAADHGHAGRTRAAGAPGHRQPRPGTDRLAARAADRRACGEGDPGGPELRGLPLLRPEPHDRGRLHRDDVPLPRTHSPGPGRPRHPRTGQTLTSRNVESPVRFAAGRSCVFADVLRGRPGFGGRRFRGGGSRPVRV
ncbi:pentapeptide repeat-containing protein [Embleya sp. NPDC055664]